MQVAWKWTRPRKRRASVRRRREKKQVLKLVDFEGRTASLPGRVCYWLKSLTVTDAVRERRQKHVKPRQNRRKRVRVRQRQRVSKPSPVRQRLLLLVRGQSRVLRAGGLREPDGQRPPGRVFHHAEVSKANEYDHRDGRHRAKRKNGRHRVTRTQSTTWETTTPSNSTRFSRSNTTGFRTSCRTPST